MRVIILDANKVIKGVKYPLNGYILEPNEIESDIGDMGQIMQADGTFIDAPIEPIATQPTQPTNAELAQMISDLQADLIIAGVI